MANVIATATFSVMWELAGPDDYTDDCKTWRDAAAFDLNNMRITCDIGEISEVVDVRIDNPAGIPFARTGPEEDDA